jgi:hypothetical protein
MRRGARRRQLNKISDSLRIWAKENTRYAKEHGIQEYSVFYLITAPKCPKFDRSLQTQSLEECHRHVEIENGGCPLCLAKKPNRWPGA